MLMLLPDPMRCGKARKGDLKSAVGTKKVLAWWTGDRRWILTLMRQGKLRARSCRVRIFHALNTSAVVEWVSCNKDAAWVLKSLAAMSMVVLQGPAFVQQTRASFEADEDEFHLKPFQAKIFHPNFGRVMSS